MKLVLCIPTPHPFELNQEITYAVEYLSKELFMEGLKAAWQAAYDADENELVFFGIGIDMSDCTFTPIDPQRGFHTGKIPGEEFAGPIIYTLEEWWEKEAAILNNRKSKSKSDNSVTNGDKGSYEEENDVPYCTECGETEKIYIETKANGDVWGCKGCGRKYIWESSRRE